MRSTNITKTNVASVFKDCTAVHDKYFKAISAIANSDYCMLRAMEEITRARNSTEGVESSLKRAITLLGMAVLYGLQTEDKERARSEDSGSSDSVPSSPGMDG